MKTPLRVSVIMAAYNEAPTIGDILRRVKSQTIEGVQFDTLVVDDGSTDGTREYLDQHPELYHTFLKNPSNLGKGGAVKRALAAATGDYVLFQDADLEYDPADYVKLLAPVMNFQADVVMGSRFLAPLWTRVFFFWHKVGNTFITTWFNLLNNTTWTDVYSCYLLYRRDLITPVELRTSGWDQHAEILGRVSRRGKQLYEVPINYHGRSYEEGKKIRWHHMFKVLWTMTRVRVLG